jgi:subtilase family serine protease
MYRPELSISTLSVPPLAAAGRPMTIANAVRNTGSAPAAGFLVRFYLSADDALDGADVSLGSRNVAGLAAGGVNTDSTTVTIPGNTSVPGTYRVIAIVDADGTQLELDETNNTAVSGVVRMVRYQPDLTMSLLAAPATGAAGRPLAVANTVRNAGTAAAGSFVVRFFLSADDTLHPGDVLLGSRVIGTLAAGASNSVVTTLTIPANTSVPGTYRVIGVVDALDQQAELDETNNVTLAAAPTAITAYRPDLTLTALTVGRGGSAGRPLGITHTVRNVGPAPAGTFVVRFFLSSDDVLDAADVLLGTRTLATLAPGATDTMMTMITVPANTAVPGTYRVIGVVDALDQQVELDETNNTLVSAPTSLTAYLPDLTVTALGVPATAAAGRPLAITNTVRNAGPAPAGAFTVQFFLSTDGVRHEGDRPFGARTIMSLGPFTTDTAVTTLVIPADTPVPSPYRVLAIADSLGQQTETDETNNALASAGTVTVTAYQPDLVLTALSAPSTGAAGQPLAVSSTVRNAGPAPAGTFVVRFVLSADDTLDAGDVVLGTRTIAGLGIGATSSAVTTLTIPGNTSVPARYRVIALVDPLGQQAELDENNNRMIATATTSIMPYLPDLTLTSVSAPGGAVAGGSLAIASTTRNIGTAPTTGAFTIRFYLSADDVLDAGDVLVGARAISGILAAGASRTDVTTVTIPPGTVMPRPYRVIGVVDALGQQAELDEGNNVTASAAVSTAAVGARAR